MNVLYILDKKLNSTNLKRTLNSVEQDSVYVCPISVDFNDYAPETLGIELKKIDFQKIFKDNSFKYRQQFVNFIYDYSTKRRFEGKNMRELFKLPGQNASAWWFSLVAEKNTTKTDSYANFIRLLSILEIVSKNGVKKIIIDIDNVDLHIAIKDNLSNLKIVSITKCARKQTARKIMLAFILMLRLAARKTASLIFMADNKQRMARMRRSEYIMITYFPYFNKDEYAKGEYVDLFYEPLQNALKNDGIKYSWLAINCSIGNIPWAKGLQLGNSLGRMDENLLFVEEFIGFKDIVKIFLSYIAISARFMFNLQKIRETFLFGEDKLKIWQLFSNEFYSSFLGEVLIDGLYNYYSFKQLSKHCNDQAKILYYMENHAWEKALNSVFLEAGTGAKTIGIQHASVPLLLLNHFENNHDLKGKDCIQKMPKPDYLACVGKIMMNLFKNQGWPNNELFILGGLRYKYLSCIMEHLIPWQNREHRIIVALTIEPAESKEILCYVGKAFSHKSNDYKILLKSHYAGWPLERLLKESGCETGQDIFEIVDTPINELLKTAKILITAGSTTAIEALACGCCVIIPELSVLDVSPITGFTDLGIYVNSPKELRETAEKILLSSESAYDKEESKQFVANYFEKMKTDAEYLEKINELFEKRNCQQNAARCITKVACAND